MSAQRRSSTVNRRARGAAARKGAGAPGGTTTIEAPATGAADGAVTVASEPVATTATKSQPRMARGGDGTRRGGGRLDGARRYVNDTRAELRRVTWPDQITVRNLTGVVIAVSTVMGLLLGGIDFILFRLFEAL